MELKEGYKQTEVGMIPEDWRIKPLSAVAFFTNGKAHEQFIDDNGDYIVINSKFISTEGDVFKNSSVCICPLKKGDITMVMSDIPNGKALAKCYIIPKDNKYTLNQRICSLSTEVSEKRFLAYILNRNKYYLAFDSGTGQTNLTKNDVIKCPIPLPPTKAEQTAIATALSDTDALIQSLEKLIAKKRNIKQGAMQELLKPKVGWVEKTLFELADKKKEFFDDGDWIEAEYLSNEGIRLIQTGNIGKGVFLDKESKKYISQESFVKLKCKEVKEGDVLICRLAEPAGRACVMPNIGEEKMITAVDVTIFRPLQDLANIIYLINLFSTNTWFNIISEKCGGTTRTRIARGALGKVKLLLPPISEQTRIAAILSDMDAEIAGLETKLTKYKQIKQGMMQELLTGRTRLV